MKRRLLPIAVLTLSVSVLALTSNPIASAFSQFAATQKNFETEGTLSADGRQVTLNGEIGLCQPNEKTYEVQATILQSASLASATGVTQDVCPKGDLVSFTVVATVPASKPPFQEGPAQVCGFGVSRSGHQIVDTEFWCTFVTLVKG
jgi:hypothetical protein